MNSSKIRFRCPSCHTQLDVPSQLAGVTGPCPSCQATITAPPAGSELDSISAIATPSAAAPTTAALPPSQDSGRQVAPVTATPREEPPYGGPAPYPALQSGQPTQYPVDLAPQPSDMPPVMSAQPLERPPVQRGQAAFPSAPPESRREIPEERPTVPEVHPTPADPGFPLEEPSRYAPPAGSPLSNIRKMSPEAVGASTEPPAAQEPTARRKSRVPSIIFLLLFLAAVTAVIIAVLSLTKVVGLDSLPSLLKPAGVNSGPESQARNESLGNPTQSAPASTAGLPPVESNPVIIDPEDPASSSPPAVALPPSEEELIPEREPEDALPPGESFRQGETPLPIGIDAEAPSETAQVQEALQSFFLAKNLEDRAKSLSTTALALPGIEKSIFAKRIPEPIYIRFVDTFRDTEENRSDFFFIVGWDGHRNTPQRPITVELHRWHENESPRIHAEAFLEAYEDRLRRYALTPQTEPGKFHVLGRCVPRCFSDLPDASSLATLKMAPFPGNFATTDAFFPKESHLLGELKGAMMGAAMEQEIPMTVTIAWSPETTTPRYLELVRIDSFDWHP